MIAPLVIDGRPVGPGHPPLMVAELSGNHNGDLDRARRLIDAAKGAGADAVKLQTYTADTITLDHDGPGFVIEGGPWAGRRLHDLYAEAHTPWDWHQPLFDHARDAGLICFSAPFDPTAVALLDSLGAPAFKIASFEIVDLPLIRAAAATGKPMILSTGMASLEEIGEAVEAARGPGSVALLKCTSGYPTPPDESHIRAMPRLAETFDCVVGLSDHTAGVGVAVAAVALGAAIIEKHVTLARADGGPDAAFSLEPDEFARLCAECRIAWDALGEADFAPQASEAGQRGLRRSLYIVADVPQGAPLTVENMRSIRPGRGLAPKHYDELLGRRASRDLTRGSPLRWDMVE